MAAAVAWFPSDGIAAQVAKDRQDLPVGERLRRLKRVSLTAGGMLTQVWRLAGIALCWLRAVPGLSARP